MANANAAKASQYECARIPPPGAFFFTTARSLVSAAHSGDAAHGEHLLRRNVVGNKLATKFTKGARGKMRANVGHYAQIHMGVVDAHHAQAENFVHVEQVAQIGACEVPAREAFAAFFDGTEVG